MVLVDSAAGVAGTEAGGGGVADLEEGRDDGADGAAACGSAISSGSAVKTGSSTMIAADDVWLG